jgi:hypothetical protein
MNKATTKFDQVKNHLLEKKEINTWIAITRFGATRLSDIIFKLRNQGWDIKSEPVENKDRNGNPCHYVNYKLIAHPDNVTLVIKPREVSFVQQPLF